jgi:hypothetical protein
LHLLYLEEGLVEGPVEVHMAAKDHWVLVDLEKGGMPGRPHFASREWMKHLVFRMFDYFDVRLSS